MARVLIYYAHPGHRFSRANKTLAATAKATGAASFVDLYALYPRFDIDVEAEQARLLAHDVIIFQFPMFWYSTPSIIKEWLDLVLEHGFAYGTGGDSLAGKRMMLAMTAAGPEDAYQTGGYQHFPLRSFLSPLEQTARLCKMEFLPPYVLFASLKAPADGQLEAHAAGYRVLIEALRDDRFDGETAAGYETLNAGALLQLHGA